MAPIKYGYVVSDGIPRNISWFDSVELMKSNIERENPFDWFVDNSISEDVIFLKKEGSEVARISIRDVYPENFTS